MLSRIAESLFWIGRYLERAEDTCRIVEVHLQLLLDDPTVDQEAAGLSLLEVMGYPPPEGRTADAQYVLTALCYDDEAPASVATALGGARESARRARETVSTEMWESIKIVEQCLDRLTPGPVMITDKKQTMVLARK